MVKATELGLSYKERERGAHDNVYVTGLDNQADGCSSHWDWAQQAWNESERLLMNLFLDVGQISKCDVSIGYMRLEPRGNISIKNTHLKEKLWARVRKAKETDPREGKKAKAKILSPH